MNFTLFDDPRYNDPTKDERVDKLFEAWKELFNIPRAKLTPVRRAVLRKRLTQFSFEELLSALNAAAKDPFWRGRNKWNQRLDDLVTLFRNPDRVRRFLQKHHSEQLHVSDSHSSGERF